MALRTASTQRSFASSLNRGLTDPVVPPQVIAGWMLVGLQRGCRVCKRAKGITDCFGRLAKWPKTISRQTLHSTRLLQPVAVPDSLSVRFFRRCGRRIARFTAHLRENHLRQRCRRLTGHRLPRHERGCSREHVTIWSPLGSADRGLRDRVYRSGRLLAIVHFAR